MYNRLRAQRAAGYTLIELLVVLLVLGLCAGLVHALATPADSGKLDLESERLAQLLSLAATEARLGGRLVSWTSDGRAYRFQRHDDDGYAWEPASGDPLRARVLAAGVTIGELHVEGFRRRALRIEFVPHAPPQAFEIGMTLNGASATVRRTALGEISTYAHAR